MSKNKESRFTTKAQVEQFKLLRPLLIAVLNEIRELSKKKQDGVLNKLKAKTINKLLGKVKQLLAEEPTSEFLELLDEETLPTNSDAVIIIVQFDSAMEQFKVKYVWKNTHDLNAKWQTKD